MIPPPYLGQTFAEDHKHYLTAASTVLDASDVEDMIYHHGLPRAAAYSGTWPVPNPGIILCSRVRQPAPGAAVVVQITTDLNYTAPTIET